MDLFTLGMIKNLGAGGSSGGGVKITEFPIAENTAFVTWWNASGIKLVKGLNIFCSSKLNYTYPYSACAKGALSLTFMFWDGVAAEGEVYQADNACHLRGKFIVQTAYELYANAIPLTSNNYNLSSLDISEDGTVIFRYRDGNLVLNDTSKFYLEGGYTYRLIQFESDVIC